MPTRSRSLACVPAQWRRSSSGWVLAIGTGCCSTSAPVRARWPRRRGLAVSRRSGWTAMPPWSRSPTAAIPNSPSCEQRFLCSRLVIGSSTPSLPTSSSTTLRTRGGRCESCFESSGQVAAWWLRPGRLRRCPSTSSGTRSCGTPRCRHPSEPDCPLNSTSSEPLTASPGFSSTPASGRSTASRFAGRSRSRRTTCGSLSRRESRWSAERTWLKIQSGRSESGPRTPGSFEIVSCAACWPSLPSRSSRQLELASQWILWSAEAERFCRDYAAESRSLPGVSTSPLTDVSRTD